MVQGVESLEPDLPARGPPGKSAGLPSLARGMPLMHWLSEMAQHFYIPLRGNRSSYLGKDRSEGLLPRGADR
jgi:hypothetical protein